MARSRLVLCILICTGCSQLVVLQLDDSDTIDAGVDDAEIDAPWLETTPLIGAGDRREAHDEAALPSVETSNAVSALLALSGRTTEASATLELGVGDRDASAYERIGERVVASVSARRNGTRFRFVVLEWQDRSYGPLLQFRGSQIQMHTREGWSVVYEADSQELSDLLCRDLGSYALEVVDEARPLLLIRVRWRWHRCDPGATNRWVEEGVYVIARDDAGVMRAAEFRTLLSGTSSRLDHTDDDGREVWVDEPPRDDRGALHVRSDGLVTYSFRGEHRLIRLFGPDADPTIWGVDSVW